MRSEVWRLRTRTFAACHVRYRGAEVPLYLLIGLGKNIAQRNESLAVVEPKGLKGGSAFLSHGGDKNTGMLPY
jgi:hypothetical protein